ncbi:MAG: terpene cyclase/mutase family protein [Planctomycetales bacterium]|nr:terpene cyclase/mutase family protein [Planctomycetales bacterium]
MRFLSVVLISVLWASACDAADANVDDVDSKRSGILEDPYDFSKPPTLPNIDAPTQEQIEASISRGIEFLIQAQRESGAWGAATQTKGLNIYAPVPGAHDAFRSATTALCIAALLETASNNEAAMAAVDRAEVWLFEHLDDVKRATGDAIYNVWGHAYSIQALIRMRARFPDDAERIKKIDDLIRLQFDMLTRYESVDGGWGYYDFRYQARKPTSDSISFVNGCVLLAFAEAKCIGIEPPERIVKRAIAATKRQQKPDFSYLYGEYLKDQPMRGINRPGGSLGRTQCCNCALRAWGDEKITDNVIKNWIYRLYVRNGWLDIGRKRPIPHEAWMQVAGYFYYYGHYYAAINVKMLPPEEQPPYQALLADIILARQEKNGSWWDYPLYDYHQPYGTSFALMTLHRCLGAR